LNKTTLITIEDKKEILELKEDNKELKNMIKELIKENAKQQEQIGELIPKIGNNNNNTNIQNNKFNINVFLNDQCKDAINMSDFIKSLHITIEQLDFTNKKGLADGLSKSIMENMNKLSIYKRPMHCTDTKRETLYIKDDDNWSKDINKEKIKHVIKKASSKNYNALMEWKSLNPDFMNNEDKTDYFTKTISTIGKPINSIDEKVIRNLCKDTYVKSNLPT
jgi:chromosome segregation ATPase